MHASLTEDGSGSKFPTEIYALVEFRRCPLPNFSIPA
jgi:hypothetical protein